MKIPQIAKWEIKYTFKDDKSVSFFLKPFYTYSEEDFCEHIFMLYLIWSFGNGIHILDDISHNVIQR